MNILIFFFLVSTFYFPFTFGLFVFLNETIFVPDPILPLLSKAGVFCAVAIVPTASAIPLNSVGTFSTTASNMQPNGTGHDNYLFHKSTEYESD